MKQNVIVGKSRETFPFAECRVFLGESVGCFWQQKYIERFYSVSKPNSKDEMVQYMDFHVPLGLLHSPNQLAGPSTWKCQFQHREMPVLAQGNANSSVWKCQFQGYVNSI